MEEAWLSGGLPGISPLLLPAAHALEQAALDILKATRNLTDEELWMQPFGINSIGFQLKHTGGSIDRLLTYCRNEQLSRGQYEFLAAENKPDISPAAGVLTARAVENIKKAVEVIRSTTEDSLFLKRSVGRRKLPTNVFGLLFHIAEHTQRHVGQIVTTAKIVKNSAAVGTKII